MSDLIIWNIGTAKKLLMKSFNRNDFMTYINPDSDYKYRMICTLDNEIIINYINDNLEFYWKSFKVPSRFNGFNFMVTVSSF